MASVFLSRLEDCGWFEMKRPLFARRGALHANSGANVWREAHFDSGEVSNLRS